MNARNVLMFAAAFSLLFGAVHAASAYDGAVSVANLSVTPNPVVAGGNATIRFQLYNSYGFFLYDAHIQPAGSYPLLNASPQNGYTVGQIDGGLNRQYYNYTVAIPPTTPSGTYVIFFNATYYVLGSAGITVGVSSMPVSFYVRNRPTIKVLTSSAAPAALYSGYNQTVDLVIENIGYGTARNVTVSVGGEDGVNILSSVRTFFISNLTQGSSAAEPVLVSTQGSGAAGLSANVSYYSSNFGQRFSGTQVVALSVAPAAQFSINSGGHGAAPGATDVPVRFSITNTGTSEAEQVQVTLQSTYPITPVAGSAYISDLPVGATANVTFLASIDGQGAPGNYPVTIYEQWKQPNGAADQQFSGSDNYYVSVAHGAGSAELIAVAVVVIIVLAGIFTYRRRKAKTSGKSEKKK